MTRKWKIVNDQSNAYYHVGNEIIYNTEDLKTNICDQNHAYILVRGDIDIIEHRWCWRLRLRHANAQSNRV